jgi:hypothetical protein
MSQLSISDTTNTQLIHNLRGNTQITRNVRQVTKSNKPAGQAAWTLSALNDYLSSFLFEIYDINEHPALGQTPREAYMSSLKTAGARANRMITYDQAFLMATLPTTPRGTARVLSGRGVLVKVIGSGLCHTDLAARDEMVPGPKPCELGHEGSGIVFQGRFMMMRYLSHGDSLGLFSDLTDAQPTD